MELFPERVSKLSMFYGSVLLLSTPCHLPKVSTPTSTAISFALLSLLELLTSPSAKSLCSSPKCNSLILLEISPDSLFHGNGFSQKYPATRSENGSSQRLILLSVSLAARAFQHVLDIIYIRQIALNIYKTSWICLFFPKMVKDEQHHHIFPGVNALSRHLTSSDLKKRNEARMERDP